MPSDDFEEMCAATDIGSGTETSSLQPATGYSGEYLSRRSTSEDLLVRALEAERLLELWKQYRPPPQVEAALMPEVAYKPVMTSTFAKKPSKAAISESSAKDIVRIVQQVMEQKIKEREWIDEDEKQ